LAVPQNFVLYGEVCPMCEKCDNKGIIKRVIYSTNRYGELREYIRSAPCGCGSRPKRSEEIASISSTWKQLVKAMQLAETKKDIGIPSVRVSPGVLKRKVA